MRYGIRFEITGEAKTHLNNLVKEIKKSFGENQYSNKKENPHLTLKYSFNSNNIKEIEKILAEISKDSKKGKVLMKGFGNFSFPESNKFVLYAKFKPDNNCRRIQKKILKNLKEEGIEIQKRDSKWKSHSTLCITSSEESFKNIKKHLKKYRGQEFKIDFDNIVMTKKTKGKHKVYKKFKIS